MNNMNNNTTNEIRNGGVRYILNEKVTYQRDNASKGYALSAHFCDSTQDVCSYILPGDYDKCSVKNVVTEESFECLGKDIRGWLTNHTVESLSAYHITRTCWHSDEDYQINEYYFIAQSECEVAGENADLICKLEVRDTDTNETIAQKWFSTIDDLLSYADKQLFDWRYSSGERRNLSFEVNDFDISRYFETTCKYDYELQDGKLYRDLLRIRIELNEDNVEKEEGEFVCCICGKTHPKKQGMFNPSPARPKYDADGKANPCCVTCYEKYALGMQTYEQKITMAKGIVDKYDSFPEDEKELREMFYGYSMEDMDRILVEEKLHKMMGIGIRLTKIFSKEAEMRRRKEEARKERARERARERRAAAKAAKLSKESDQ